MPYSGREKNSRIHDRQPLPLELTLVVPTLNERDNIDSLLAGIEKALSGLRWELIFVDDASIDGTPERIHEIAQLDRRIRLIRRFGRRGLASAVVEGMLASTTPVVAVIDADLQHDETILPKLVGPLLRHEADVAVGTRYLNGGSTEGWDTDRLRISRAATWAAGRLLRTDCSDPMSGLFAVRRETLLAARPRLSSIGYKILLDILASSPTAPRVTEVPYRFGTRLSGKSKLDHAVELEYVELLLDKLFGRWVPPKLLMFGAVGGLGVLVHLGLLDMGLKALLLPFATAQAIAVVGAMTFNFALNNVFTYRDRQLKGWAWARGLITFYLVCSVGAVGNVGIGALVYHQSSTWWLAGIAGAIVGAVWNFVGSSWLTWTRR
jgi:dolichol-phosphate mannosyltransferase